MAKHMVGIRFLKFDEMWKCSSFESVFAFFGGSECGHPSSKRLFFGAVQGSDLQNNICIHL